MQFVAFRAAAREARAAASPPLSRNAVAAPVATAAASTAVTPVPPPLAGVPPQLVPGGSGRGTGQAPSRGSGGPSAPLDDLAAYAGLLQRVFVGLLMAWTLLVALGIVPD